MAFYDTQNPGIGGLKELTSSELSFVQSLAALGDPNADRILFWDDSAGAFAYLTAGSGLSITGTTLTATGTIDGSGSAGTIAFWSDADTLTYDAHFTYDAVNDVLHAHKLAGDATDGLIIESANGTDIGILGAGNTANVTWYGSHNFDTATQDTIAAFTGAGKTLGSLALATYPSLSEIAHVKGVTSAIQTQLNAKQASDATLTAIAALADGAGVLTNDGVGNLSWAAAGAGANTALSNLASVAINTTLVSDTDNTDALGTLSIAWSDLFLGNGAVINFTSSAGVSDVTITHSSNLLTIAGGDLALGSNNLTMTGSLAATGARVTKGWFTDIESTNMITIGGTSLLALGNTWSALQTISLGGVGLRVVNTTDNASVQVAKFEGDRATMADGDEAYNSFLLSNDGGTQTEVARMTWVATDVNAGTSVDGRIDFGVMTGGSLADELSLDGTKLFPSTSDGLALGDGTNMWSDLFLASGAVINFNNGNATITHSAGLLTSNVDIAVPDEAYGVGWNGSTEVPTKNAVYDKIETIGGGSSCVTIIPMPMVPAIDTANVTITVNTTMYLGLVVIPFSITVNKLTIKSGSATTPGKLTMSVYSEDGQTRHISVTTAANVESSTLVTTTVSSVALSAGNYWFAVNGVDASFSVNCQVWSFGETNAFGKTAGILYDVASEPILQGTLTITANTPPTTIDPTALTEPATWATPVFRLDN